MSERRGEKGDKKSREREASASEVREYAEATILGVQQALDAFKIEIQSAANSASLVSKAEKKFEQAKKQIKGYSQLGQIDSVKERFGNDLEVLKSNVVESPTKSEDATSELPSLEKLRNIETNFAASSGEVFRQIINLETEVRLESLEKITEAKIVEIKETEDELAHVNIHFTQGLPGGMAVLLPKSATARIVDYMIMGDGDVDFMPEEHLDGMLEATNQLVSNELDKLSNQFSISLQSESQLADLKTPEEIGESYNGWQAAKFLVTIKGQEPFVMWKLIAPETGAKLEELSSKSSQEAQPQVENTGAPENKLTFLNETLDYINSVGENKPVILAKYRKQLNALLLAEASLSLEELKSSCESVVTNFDAEMNNPEQLVETENVILVEDFERELSALANLSDLKAWLKNLAETNKILDFGDKKYELAVLFRRLDAFSFSGKQEPDMPASLRDKLAEFGFFDPQGASENQENFVLAQEVDKLKQKITDNEILDETTKTQFLTTEFTVFENQGLTKAEFFTKAEAMKEKFVVLVESTAKLKLKEIFDNFVSTFDETQSELKDKAQQHFASKEAALGEARVEEMVNIVKSFASELEQLKNITDNENIIQKTQAELEAMLVSVNSAHYGEKSEEASLLVAGSIDALHGLDKSLATEQFLAEVKTIQENLALELDKLKKQWFEGQDKLKFVDLNPEAIREALKTGKVVEGLKTLLASKEGQGKTGLQEALQTVLQNYFEEQKSNLSLAEQKKLTDMISSLSAEVAEEITEDFKTALEEQAHKDMGWFAKAKSKFSLLMTAQFGTTLAVGFGAGALAVALAPVFGLGVLATGGVALGGAAMGRAGIGWGFAKIRKARNESARMNAKEQAAFEQSKKNILEKGVSVEIDQKEQKRDFISTDLLATVIANKLRVKTSENLSSGHVVDKDGKLIPEAMAILKQNVHDLIETDPRYADLSPEDKKEEEIKLISLLSLGLIEQENILLTASSHLDNPAWLKNMDRIRSIMTGNTGGNLEEMNARSAFGHVLAAGAIGTTVGLVLRSHRGLAAASAGLGGLSFGWKMGEMMADQAMVKEYYSAIDSLVEKGDGLIKDILSKRDLQLSQYTNLENDVIKIQGYLSLKQDEKTPLISDPIIRARAENFVYQFNKLKGEKFVQEIVVESEVKNNEPGGIEETLTVLATRVDKEQKELVESLAERVQKKASATKRRQILLAAGGAIGAAALTWFLRGGSAHAAENTEPTTNHDVAGATAGASAAEVAKENIPNNSSAYIYRAPWEEAKNPDWHPPMAPEDASVPKTFDMTDNSSSAATAESPISSVNAPGINVENMPDQAAAAVVDTHHVTTTNAGALENVIRTEKGMQGHDSIWSSTKDIVKSDPEKFGYTGDANDTGSIAKFAEIKTAELVGQLEQTQGGDLKDLVHNGDKVIVHFEGNKAILSFEESSGIKASHLPDFTAKTEASIDNTTNPASTSAFVGPETPVASMENFVSGKAPYSAEILKSIIDKPAELNTLAERIFESATTETQKQFLHDLYPNSFSDATNKTDVFLHYVENAPDVDVKDLDSVKDLDNWVKNFDAQASSDELPGKNWEVRLLTDDKGNTFYAMVHEAKKHIFAQDEFVVDDIKGHTWSLKEKVVESWLKNSSESLPASEVTPEIVPTETQPEMSAPEKTPALEPTEKPLAPENIPSSGRMDNVQLEGGQKLNFNYDETGKITSAEMSGRISGDIEMLKGDFRRAVEAKLGRLTPDAVSVVQNYGRSISLNTEFLNHLVETGQANTPEADFLADKILRDISQVETLYGDVFKDIKPSLDGKIEFADVVQPSAQVTPENVPVAPAENPVETPVEPDIVLGEPRSFEQLFQMKEGAEYHHGDLFVFKKDGALFTLDVMGKEPLLIRNQADLDRFAGK